MHPFPVSFRWLTLGALAAALALPACGDDKETPKADATSTADVPGDVTADTVADVAGTDAAVQDLPPADLPPADVQPTGKTCVETLICALQCADKPGDPTACVAGCGAAAAPAAQQAFGDWTSCVVDLCKDATSTSARNACAWGKCYDKMATCGGFGAGDLGCTDTAVCAARCSLGDHACRVACLGQASKDAGTSYKDMIACSLAECGTVTGADNLGTCVADKCQGPANACKGAGLDCTYTAGCLAKCPVPLPDKPNICAKTCTMLASAEGLATQKALTDCKALCPVGVTQQECFKKTCGDKQTACFGTGGTSSCQEVYKCVTDTCDGIGGKPSCIKDCIAKGTTDARDAFVHYEGCILIQLDTQNAKTAGCTFPYDQTTCINQLNGFCQNQSSGCFKPQ